MSGGPYLTYSFDDNDNSSVAAAKILAKYGQSGAVTAPYIKDVGAWDTALKWSDIKYLQDDARWEVASHTLTHVELTSVPLNYSGEQLTGWTNVSGGVYSANYTYGDAHVFDGAAFLDREFSLSGVSAKRGTFFLDPNNDKLYVHTSSGNIPSTAIHATSAEREIAQSKEFFAANGINTSTLVYPYGSANPDVENLVKAYGYTAAAIVYIGMNTFPEDDPYKIVRNGATYGEGTTELTPDEAKQVLSVSSGSDWLVLMFHGLGSGNSWTAADLDGFASWVQQQGIETVRFKDAVNGDPVNNIPVAFADAYTTNKNTPLTIPLPAGVLTNDSDADGDLLKAVLKTGPSNGTLLLNEDGSFVYTPRIDYSGTDQFTYAASDGTAESNTATVAVDIRASNLNVIIGTNENDNLTGTAGADKIDALSGNDKLTGKGGNDVLLGGPGKDTLSGGARNDTIDGGTGNDRYTGGADIDEFIIGNVTDNVRQTETITDFVRGVDKIRVVLVGGSYDLSIVKSGSTAYVVDSNSNDRVDPTEDVINAVAGLGPSDFLFG